MNGIRATYLVETDLDLHEFGKQVCYEQTVGLKIDKDHYRPQAVRECEAKVARVLDTDRRGDKEKNANNKGLIEIEYPFRVFDETGGLPQILAIIAGQIFAAKNAKKLRLLDIDISDTLIKRFKGPRFGNAGIREQLLKDNKKRPLIGVIMRPNLGLDAKAYSELAYEVARGGADFIKDDEKFINPDYCAYEERIELVHKKLRQAKKKKDRPTIYIVNATTRPDKLIENVERLKSLGVEIVLIDALCVGLSSIEALSTTDRVNMPLYCHRAGYAAFARSADFGIDTLVITKLLRLVGADMFAVGMIGGVQDVRINEVKSHYDAATCAWYHLKDSLPIATAGMHPGAVSKNLKIYGSDIVLFVGIGVHGHPRGSCAGVVAMRQAIDAALQNESLEEAQKKHTELREALENLELLIEGPSIT